MLTSVVTPLKAAPFTAAGGSGFKPGAKTRTRPTTAASAEIAPPISPTRTSGDRLLRSTAGEVGGDPGSSDPVSSPSSSGPGDSGLEAAAPPRCSAIDDLDENDARS